jgi:WD40 repeat protein
LNYSSLFREFDSNFFADTVTGLSLSPDGAHVLSNGMDNTVRMWDVRPFATTRQVRVFSGAQHNFEKNLLKVRGHVGGGCCFLGVVFGFLVFV